MSYNNLNGIKLINGLPADLNAFNKLIENDTFFKVEVDTDENLSALDRDIIPTIDNQFQIGNNSFKIKDIFAKLAHLDLLSLPAGTSLAPSLNFGGVNGFYSPLVGQLAYMSGLNQTLLLASDRVSLQAANNTQLSIISSEPGFEATWKLGGNATDFGLTFVGNVTTKVLSLTKDAVIPLKPIQVIDGLVSAPSISFSSDQSIGIYKDISTLSFAANGFDTLRLNADSLSVLSTQILAKDGTSIQPAYSFQNAINTGFSTNLLDYIEVSIIGSLAALIRETGISSISDLGATTGTKTFSNTEASTLSLEKALGTFATPLPVADGNVIGVLRADGFIERIAGEDFYSYESGALEFIAQDAFDNTKSGGYISVKTTPKGTNLPVERLTIGKDGKASLSVEGSLGINATTITGPATLLEVDVNRKSKLLINGTVEIKGFSNGKEGQILHIVKLNNTGSFTLLHNNATAVQSVWLKGSSTFTISNDFGGIILSFDGGQWREISRS